MKIKDTLDLCGWELWNFCIQNHQNLEGLLDLGAGRKVFYTGNDQGKNGREVIYDGSKWKVSAYMSDVDELRGLITALENATDEEIEALKGRATTTEGNLATLRSEFDALSKALNEDTAGTIDTWNEIQNFVGKYDGSEDLETILSRMNAEIDTKLDKAGGTIRGDFSILNYRPDIEYINSDEESWGRIGFYSKGVAAIYDNTTWRTILHEGNYSKYALPLSGGTIGDGKAEIPLSVNGISTNVTIALQANGTAKGYLNWNNTWGTCLIDGGNTNYRLGIKADGTPYYSNAASATHTLLHSGNVGEYALKTDGSNEMSGAIKFTGKTLAADASAKDSGIRMYSFSEVEAAPSNSIYHSTFSAISSYVGFQLSVYGGANTNDLYYRKIDGEGNWSDWKTIAFTDSTVAAAQKLVTSAGKDVLTHDNFNIFPTGGVVMNPNAEGITIGYDSISWHNSSNVWTKDIIILNSSGNVTIGGNDLAGSDYKLVVDGLSRFNNNVESDGNVIGAGAVQAKTSAHGFVSLQVGSTGNKGLLDSRTSWFIYTDGTNTFLPRGNVGIGTTSPSEKLHVVGQGLFTDILTAKGGINVTASDGALNTGQSGVAGVFLRNEGGIEISHASTPYIDLHFANSTSDFNHRLIARDSGIFAYSGNYFCPWGSESLGASSYRWQYVYAKAGSFSHDMEINGALTVGAGATFNGDLHVKGNIIADGEVSAGGAGTEGGNTGGGGTGTITNPYVVNFTPSNETSHSFYHNLPYYDVVVQVYEKNAISGAWDMILADVTIANESNLVTVNFGRKEDVEHKIVVR